MYKLKNKNTQIKYNSEKQTTQNTAKQNYPGSVAFYDTRPGNEVGLFYNTPEHTQGGFKAVLTFLFTEYSIDLIV